MRKYIYISRLACVLILVLCLQPNIWAYDFNYAGCYTSMKLDYQSVDENNNPITLSEVITLPLEKDSVTNREIGFFVLSSMPYNDDKDKASSSSQPMDALLLRTIATEGAMTVQLDAQGFGTSDGHTIPFLISRLEGRQAIDGLIAAMDYAKSQGIKISDNYYTISAGYSLAGYRAVAAQRYLEKYASADQRAVVRLRKTVCGGAPINGIETAKYIMDNYDHLYSYLSLIEGFVTTYCNSTLHAYSMADFYGSDNKINRNAMNGETPSSKALLKALAKENMDEDWIPEAPIIDYHLSDDDIVTYRNAQSASEHWGSKINLVERQLPGRKWNVSLLHNMSNLTELSDTVSPHILGAISYYAGMIDGCLRDTVITDVYGRDMSYKDMLNVIFDLGSGLNRDISVNIPVSIPNGTLVIKSFGYLHFTGDIQDNSGTTTANIDITVKPEALDYLHSHLTGVKANGYLLLPVTFDITLPSVADMEIYGTCNDLYQMLENLTAIMLHHSCASKDDAKKLCEAFNGNVNAKAKISLLNGFIKLDVPLYAWYFSDNGKYEIRPAAKILNKDCDIIEYLKDKGGIDVSSYITIDGQSFTVSDYNVTIHVVEDNYGEQKIRLDIKNAQGLSCGTVNLDITGVNMNDDGTRQTLNIGIDAVLDSLHAKMAGKCSNLNDAVLAGILCYGNLACETKSQAQAYADAVNSNLTLELYVQKADDDGTYPLTPEYIDYGYLHAVVAQDENDAYYVQYCLNKMGKEDIPLDTVINELTK